MIWFWFDLIRHCFWWFGLIKSTKSNQIKSFDTLKSSNANQTKWKIDSNNIHSILSILSFSLLLPFWSLKSFIQRAHLSISHPRSVEIYTHSITHRWHQDIQYWYRSLVNSFSRLEEFKSTSNWQIICPKFLLCNPLIVSLHIIKCSNVIRTTPTFRNWRTPLEVETNELSYYRDRRLPLGFKDRRIVNLAAHAVICPRKELRCMEKSISIIDTGHDLGKVRELPWYFEDAVFHRRWCTAQRV